MAIYFWGHTGEYGFMSNFYPASFTSCDGNIYNCNEQYFMKKKQELFDPENIDLAKKIMAETKPSKIRQFGREVKNYNDQVWSRVRFDHMLDGLRMKFNQNPQLAQMLLATGDVQLYEASPVDRIWGIGYNPQTAPKIDKALYGHNLLGYALMKVRGEINNT